MKEYIEYALFNRDDSPLYLFEGNIEQHEQAKAILSDYEPPRHLRQDLFAELVSNFAGFDRMSFNSLVIQELLQTDGS